MKRTRAQAGLPYGHPIRIERRRQIAILRRNNAQMRNRVVPGYTQTRGRYARANSTSQKKYFDTQDTNNVATTGNVFASLNLIPAGTTDLTRVGGKCNISNLDVKFAFSLDQQASAVGGILSGNVRFIMFIDTQANGATAAVADILTSASIYSFRNMDTVDRFRILCDKMYNVTPQSAIWNGTTLYNGVGATKYFKKSWKKMNLPIHFSSTTGAITEIKSNNIGFLMISDNGGINYTLNARVKFYDA